MLITLGFGTQMTSVETLVATIVDFWPSKLQKRKPFVLALVCVVMLLSALPMCTGVSIQTLYMYDDLIHIHMSSNILIVLFQAGIYILQLMDSYCVPYSAFIIGFFEIIAIAWVYGIERHMNNIHRMMGFSIRPAIYWRLMFKYGCPIIIIVILAMTISKLRPLKYNDYTFPIYAEYIGWALTAASVIMIPIFAIFELSLVYQGNKKLKVMNNKQANCE